MRASLDQELSGSFCVGIQRIALLAILDRVAAITLMLLLSAPIQEASPETEQAGELQVVLTCYLFRNLTTPVPGPIRGHYCDVL